MKYHPQVLKEYNIESAQDIKDVLKRAQQVSQIRMFGS